jgi:ribosomal protein L37E
MVKKDQTIQWSRKIRQYNGQERLDNAMVKKNQTIQWSRKIRQYNGQEKSGNTMVKRKTNNDLQNII